MLFLAGFFLLPTAVMAQLGQRSSSIFERVKEPTCRPVDIALCRDIPYNRTIYPNPFVELDLASLQAQTEHFKPLIRTRCSPHILFFICSVFAPMCPEQVPQAVTSCRSVCEEVQRDCIKIFHDFDFPWPPVLNCSRFPSPPALCMRPEPGANEAGATLAPQLPPATKMPECPQDLVDLEPNEPTGKCAFRCEKTTMFRKDRKEQARLWLLCWALLNAGIALFTVCSFCIDGQRFRFPERSVCFIAFCALLNALPHLLRAILGFDQIACSQLPSGAKFLILGGIAENRACLASFILAYYFAMAGSCWWLVLGFTWYLSGRRKWVEEEIGKRAVFLHLLAWGIPAFAATGTFSAQLVDASELTGICSIGNSDPLALLWFWIVPKLALTLCGLFLMLAGFSAMCKERHSFRRRGTDTSRLEKFLLRMGSFAALYVTSSIVASFCDLHHLFVLIQWHPNTIGCKAHGGVFSGQCIRPEQPQPELYILGQTMLLAAGLATGIWMFSPKTLIAWRRTLLCCWPAAHPTKQMGAAAQQQQLQHFGMAPIGFDSLGFSPAAQSRQASLPPSLRPLLSNLPTEPPPLPPPPPTAVPSSTYGHFFTHQQFMQPSATSGPSRSVETTPFHQAHC